MTVTLLLPLLLETMHYAKEQGFVSTLATNGYWGNLKDGFLKMKKLNISVSLTYGDVLYGKRPSDMIRELGEDAHGITSVIYPFYPTGGGNDCLNKEDFIQVVEKQGHICPSQQSLTVFYDGTIYPCCSQFLTSLGLFQLGNISDFHLKDVIKGLHQNPYLYVLMRNGFDWFVELAENTLGYSLPDHYCIVCHLCNTIFSNKELTDKMLPFVKKEEERLRLKSLLG